MNPEEFEVGTLGQALDEAQFETTVIWTDDHRINGYLQGKPEAAANYIIFGHNFHRTQHVLLCKNSPLTPMFKQGFLRLFENGKLDRLLSKWMRVAKRSRKLSLKSRIVVGISQVVLIFYIMVGTIGATLLLLGLEMMWNKQVWRQIPVFKNNH